MTNKKPIVVKLGDHPSKRLEKKENESTLSSNYEAAREQAATTDDEEIQPYIRNYENESSHYSKKRNLKPIIFAITSAIVIGTALGFLLLGLYVNLGKDLENPSGVDPVTTPSAGTNDNNNDDDDEQDSDGETDSNSLVRIPTLDGYILQGGVFSDIANANDFASIFIDEGMPAVIWERDNQYYLIAGIANTKENGQSIAESITNEEIEVYVKEWSTPTIEKDVSEEEIAWFTSFQEQWNSIVAAVSEQGIISVNELERLYNEYPTDSEMISEFVNSTMTHQEDLAQASQQEMGYYLMEIWKAYEQVLNQE